MTTSITDARFTYLHSTSLHLLSLSIDEDPEVGWGVMPGFDQNIAIPPHHEPPRMDADETLPSMMHPSYPYGRGPTVAKALRGGGLNGAVGVQVGGEGLGAVGLGYGDEQGGMSGSGGAAADRSGPVGSAGAGTSSNRDMARLFGGQGSMGARERDRWIEFGLDGILEREKKKEAPPVMAGARRPPTPPSPSLHPQHDPLPRSEHVRNARQRERERAASPQNGTGDPFDAPVPNETYQEQGQQQGQA